MKELFSEAVSADEKHDNFVHTKLKLRCFEIFQSFDRGSQEQLMETIDHLIMADGEAHPAEVKFRAELSALLEADLAIELEEDAARPHVSVMPPAPLPRTTQAHPFFDQFEHHYSRDSQKIMRQMSADREVVQRAARMFREQGAAGAGKLGGKQNVMRAGQ